jgi:hypothetical protein
MKQQTIPDMMKSGTIVDATVISAPSSTKKAEKARDPEMHQTNASSFRLIHSDSVRACGNRAAALRTSLSVGSAAGKVLSIPSAAYFEAQ